MDAGFAAGEVAVTEAEYLTFLRNGGARGVTAANAARLITKVRSGRLRHNPEVIDLCRALAKSMNLGGAGEPQKPPRDLYRTNLTEYHRLYARWRRWQGQSGKPGNQHGSECRP